MAKSLADIRTQLATDEGALAKLAEARPGLARAKLLGEAGAAARLDEADREAADRRARVAALRAEAAQLELADRAARAAEAAKDAAGRPAAVARRRAAALAADADIDRLAQELRAAIDKKHQVERELDAALDSPHFGRTRQALLTSIPSSVAQYFVLNEAKPWNDPNNSLLGLRTQLFGPEIKTSLYDRDQKRLDDLVRLFATQDEAALAQARLAARGEQTVALALPCGTWMLLAAECVAETRDRAEAVAARERQRGARAAIIEIDGCFVVVDPHISGGLGETAPQPEAA